MFLIMEYRAWSKALFGQLLVDLCQLTYKTSGNLKQVFKKLLFFSNSQILFEPSFSHKLVNFYANHVQLTIKNWFYRQSPSAHYLYNYVAPHERTSFDLCIDFRWKSSGVTQRVCVGWPLTTLPVFCVVICLLVKALFCSVWIIATLSFSHSVYLKISSGQTSRTLSVIGLNGM